jgi:signal transduction histidine kinase/ligand-binding sensor domain-containing protein
LLALSAHAGPAEASVLSPFRHTSWTGRDGAPQGINALAQSTDGYLWLGTSSGLYRFDGLRFSTYIPPAGSPQFNSLDIVALAADAHDGLWIGFRVGGLSYLSGGRLTNYDAHNGLPMNYVEQILTQANGAVWAVAGGKLLQFSGSAWHAIGAETGLPPNGVRNVFFDRSGTMWVAADHSIYFRTNGHSQFLATADQVKAVTQFLEAPDGSLWISDGWTSIRPIGRGEAPGSSIKIRGTSKFIFGPNQSIWIANDYYGLDVTRSVLSANVQEPPELEHFGEPEGLTFKECWGILQDREGDIWVGTGTGLDRFQESKFQPFTDVRLKSFPALAAGLEGIVWIGSLGRPLLAVNGQGATPYGPNRGWGPIYRDKNNIIWQYDYWEKELTAFDGKEFVHVDGPPALDKKAVVQSITGDQAGNLFVSFENDGIWRKIGQQWQRVILPGKPSKLPLSLLADSAGRLWAGFPDGEIALNEGGHLKTFHPGERQNLGSVMTLYETGAQIWAGGTNGLVVFTGKDFRQVQALEGIALRGISGIVKATDGDLWLNAAPGIVRLGSNDLNRALRDSKYKVREEIFDFRDGIKGEPAQLRPTPTAVADSSGRLWFATASNVVSIDPASIHRQRALPQVVIEGLRSNGVDQPIPASGQISVRPRNLQIDYVGISLASPQRVTYRYKLDGEDVEWQEAGARRQALYTSLAPGRYRLHVAASIGDGRWSELEFPADIVVPPAFYQRAWFIFVCVAALLTALGIGHQLRMQHVTARIQEQLEVRTAERVKIARDLHDTLLQGIHGLMLRFHFAAQQIPASLPAREMIDDALNAADRVMDEGRERVRTLRYDALSRGELAAELAKAGEEMNWDGKVRFHVSVEGSSVSLHPVVEDELYLIGREAVANAFKHAQASQIEVEINSDGSTIRLRCRDNGCGIDLKDLQRSGHNGHWGYFGMQERAEKIGATLECWSAPGQGTEITVTRPVAVKGPLTTPLLQRLRWPMLTGWLRLRGLYKSMSGAIKP